MTSPPVGQEGHCFSSYLTNLCLKYRLRISCSKRRVLHFIALMHLDTEYYLPTVMISALCCELSNCIFFSGVGSSELGVSNSVLTVDTMLACEQINDMQTFY